MVWTVVLSWLGGMIVGLCIGIVVMTAGGLDRARSVAWAWYVLHVQERELVSWLERAVGLPLLDRASLGCAIAALSAAVTGPSMARLRDFIA